MSVEVMTNSLVVAVSNGGSAVSSGATSITVSFVSGGTGAIPAVSSQTMRCYWDGEIVTVTANSGTGNVNWTIVRGTESTVAVMHADASLLYQIVTVAGLQQYVADQITGNLVAGAGISLSVASNLVTIANTSFKLIASSVLGSPAATVTFSSIPATYNHLRVMSVGRSANASNQDQIIAQFNGDTGANYDFQDGYFFGTGSSSTNLGAVGGTGTASPSTAYITASTSTANYPGTMVIEIPSYANTTFYKSTVGLSTDLGGSLAFNFLPCSSWWRNTAAINAILLKLATGSNFVTGSSFYLYGY